MVHREFTPDPDVVRAVAEPTVAWLSESGRKMTISFDGRDVHTYVGPDFSKMSLEEIEAYIALIDRM